MISYTIKVDGVKTATVGGLQDVVKQVNYTVKGVADGQSFELPVKVELEDPNPADFVPFQSLTESQVVAWIEELPQTVSTKLHIQLVVDKMVKEAGLQEAQMPWAPPPAPAPEPSPA